MDGNTDNKQQTVKKRSYKDVLDDGLAPKQRRIAVRLLEPSTYSDIVEDTGVNPGYIQQTIDNSIGVKRMTQNAISEKTKVLDELIGELDGIIKQIPEAQLKWSDKLKAIELKAKFKGVTEEKQGDTYNVGIFDLKYATEEELVKELDRIEKAKRNVIDIDGSM